MIIVSDTSPISNLLLVNQLNLLKELFGEVIIPPAVNKEILALQSLDYNISVYLSSDWIKIIKPVNTQLVENLLDDLDEGESEAIALAKEIMPDYIIIDERRAYKIAIDLHLPVIGLLGILLIAKQEGKIEKIKPVIDDLKSKTTFRISDKLVTEVLKRANE